MKLILLLLISTKVFSAYPSDQLQYKMPLHTDWKTKKSASSFNSAPMVNIKNNLLSENEKGGFDLEAIKEAQRKLDDMSDKEIKKSLTMPSEINRESTLKSTKKIRSQIKDIEEVDQFKSIKRLEEKKEIDFSDIDAVRKESLDKILKHENDLNN